MEPDSGDTGCVLCQPQEHSSSEGVAVPFLIVGRSRFAVPGRCWALPTHCRPAGRTASPRPLGVTLPLGQSPHTLWNRVHGLCLAPADTPALKLLLWETQGRPPKPGPGRPRPASFTGCQLTVCASSLTEACFGITDVLRAAGRVPLCGRRPAATCPPPARPSLGRPSRRAASSPAQGPGVVTAKRRVFNPPHAPVGHPHNSGALPSPPGCSPSPSSSTRVTLASPSSLPAPVPQCWRGAARTGGSPRCCSDRGPHFTVLTGSRFSLR